jgi:hypothetical protein
MNRWLKDHFQSDELPPKDVLQAAYDAAIRVLHDTINYPNANRVILSRLIEEMEADPEICNILE